MGCQHMVLEKPRAHMKMPIEMDSSPWECMRFERCVMVVLRAREEIDSLAVGYPKMSNKI